MNKAFKFSTSLVLFNEIFTEVILVNIIISMVRHFVEQYEIRL